MEEKMKWVFAFLFIYFMFLSFGNFFGEVSIGDFNFGDTEFRRYGFSILFLLVSALSLYNLLED